MDDGSKANEPFVFKSCKKKLKHYKNADKDCASPSI